MNARGILAAGVVAAAVAAPAAHGSDHAVEPPLVLTPEAAVERALRDHPSIAEQRAVLDQRDARIREAWAAAYPEVELNASGVRSRDPGLLNSPNFRELADAGLDPAFLLPIPVTTWDYRIGVEQLLYSFGKVSRGIDAAKLSTDSERLRLRLRELVVARDVLVAFFGLARAKARAEVLEAERISLEEQVRRARDFLDVGAGTRLQLLQAEAALASLRPREIDARGEIRAGRARLNETMGRDPTAPVDVDMTWLADAEIPEAPPLARLIEASRGRADLEALRRDGEVFDHLAAIERRTLRPELRFAGSYGIRTIDDDNLLNDEFAAWDAGVYVDFPLFDGHAARSRARQYDAQKRQTDARTRGRSVEIGRDLVVAVEAYDSGVEAERASVEAVAQAEESLRVAREEARWGAATTLDVLEAERTLRNIRLLRLEAIHDALVAWAEMRFQVGLLPGEPWPASVTAP